MTDLVEKVARAIQHKNKAAAWEDFAGDAKAAIPIIRDDVLEKAANRIRADCPMCVSGYADHGNSPDECEYCGRPIAAIRAMKGKADD